MVGAVVTDVAATSFQGVEGTVWYMSSVVKLVGPLVAWSVFVWGSRLCNIWTADDLWTNGQILRTVFAGIFLALGCAMGWRLWARRGRALEQSTQRLLMVLIIWTVGFWLVRGIGIMVDDHTLGFTVVHTVLMVISIGLAVIASRALNAANLGSISSSRAVAR